MDMFAFVGCLAVVMLFFVADILVLLTPILRPAYATLRQQWFQRPCLRQSYAPLTPPYASNGFNIWFAHKTYNAIYIMETMSCSSTTEYVQNK